MLEPPDCRRPGRRSMISVPGAAGGLDGHGAARAAPSRRTPQARPARGHERMTMVTGSNRRIDQNPTPNLPAWFFLPSLLEA